VHSNPASTTKSDEFEDYLGDEKNDYSEYDEGDDDQTSSSSSSTTTTEKPFSTSNHDVNSEIGKSVTLKCNSDGLNKDSIIMWYNESKILFSGVNKVSPDDRLDFSKKDGTMVISDVSSFDDATYRCRVYGRKTNFETFIKLQVNGPPRGITINEHSQKNVNIAGTTFNYHAGKKNLQFTCNVAKSRPAAKIDWSHNGNTILEALGKDHDLKVEENVLIIRNVHARHAGEYQCEATNDLGTEKASFKVDVECELKF
jgi:uncharacterized protein YodC (DUF2158 family)